MRSSAIIFLLLAMVYKSQCSYVAIAPKVFHPGWKYAVQLTVVNAPNTGIRMTVTGNIFNAKKQSLGAGIVSFDNGQSAMLEIEVGANIKPDPNNMYSLQLDGSGALHFSNSTSLQMAPLSRLVFIQADRIVYTTGQLIRFRVVIVDEDLTPLYIPKNITIKNPHQNTLARFYCNGSKGVYENTYQLADFPELGDWYIAVQSSEGNIDQKVRIRVVEKVTPELEVSATVAPDLLVKESSDRRFVTVSVTARDMNGKGVTGDVKVSVLGHNMVVNTKMLDFSGLKDVEVDLNRELATAKNQLILLVEVKDDTGRKSSTKVKLRVQEKPVHVYFDPRRTDHVYRTGMPFIAVLRVTDAMEQALPSTHLTSELLMMLTDRSNHSNTVNHRLTLTPGQKEVVWNLTKLHSTTDQLYLTASFVVQGRKYEANETIRKYKVLGKGTLNVRWLGLAPNLTMGSTASFIVDKCNATNFTTITYMIVSRGNIQTFGTVTLGQRVNVLVTPHMCPKGRLVVYGLTEEDSTDKTSELIADSLYLTTTHCQGKRVRPTLKSNNLEAGSNIAVSLDVEWTDPQKQQTRPVDLHDVYIMAVDKRIIDLQGQYDITPSRVEKALNKIVANSTEGRGELGGPPFSQMAHTSTSSSQISTGDLLESLGLQVLGDVNVLDTHAVNPKQPENTEDHTLLDMSEPTHFPDTWLWKTGRTDGRGKLTLVETLPDTVTSWMVSAFAVRKDNELALTSQPLQLNTFNKFYVHLNVPRWVRRGEKVEVRATVFNNDIINMDTTVTLAPSDNYIISGGSTENLMVKRNQAGSVTFTVVADKLGSHAILVTAMASRSNGATVTDTDEKHVTVQSEGMERTKTLTMAVELPESKKPYDHNVSLDFTPWHSQDVLTGSQSLQVRVTGDLLGNVMKHLEKLVMLPTACGEQNLLSMGPSIHILTYLTNTKKLHVDFDARAKDLIRQGYLREVQQYRWNNGGYSAFGAKDQEASTWLTAVVVKTFAQARPYMPEVVDMDIVNSAVQFLYTRQDSATGQFFERARVLQEEMQNGAGAAESLSVFVTICLLEAKKQRVQVDENRLRQGMGYVTRVLSGRAVRENQFLASLTAYALALNDAKSYTTQDSILSLTGYIQAKGAPWERKGAVVGRMLSSMDTAQPSSRDVQITSYLLLALNAVSKVTKARQLLLWLVSNQNDLGGFRATQDTLIAIQAMSEQAVHFVRAEPYNDVVVTALLPAHKPRSVHIDSTNAALLHTVQLPNETKKVNIYVTGDANTVAVVKVVLTYNTAPNIQEKERTNNNYQKLSVVTRSTMLRPGVHNIQACISKEVGLQYHSMVVLCLALPSGFEPENLLETATQNTMAARVHHTGDKVHFYMHQPINDCLNLKIQEKVKIDNLKPGLASLVAYYMPEVRSEAAIAVGCADGRCSCPGSGCEASHAITGAQPSYMLLVACFSAMLSFVFAV